MTPRQQPAGRAKNLRNEARADAIDLRMQGLAIGTSSSASRRRNQNKNKSIQTIQRRQKLLAERLKDNRARARRAGGIWVG